GQLGGEVDRRGAASVGAGPAVGTHAGEITGVGPEATTSARNPEDAEAVTQTGNDVLEGLGEGGVVHLSHLARAEQLPVLQCLPEPSDVRGSAHYASGGVCRTGVQQRGVDE